MATPAIGEGHYRGEQASAIDTIHSRPDPILRWIKKNARLPEHLENDRRKRTIHVLNDRLEIGKIR